MPLIMASKELITAIKSNFSKGDEYPLAQLFKKIKDQLIFEDGLFLLNNRRIVVPVQKRRNIDKASCLSSWRRKNKTKNASNSVGEGKVV